MGKQSRSHCQWLYSGDLPLNFHRQLPFWGSYWAKGPQYLLCVGTWGVGLNHAAVALPPQGVAWPGHPLSELPFLLMASASSNSTCLLRPTYRHTRVYTHIHVHARTTARVPTLGRVNSFTRGSDRPVSQEKKCGQTRPSSLWAPLLLPPQSHDGLSSLVVKH